MTKPESLRSEVSNTFMFKFDVGDANEGRGGEEGAAVVEGRGCARVGKCVRPDVQARLEEQTP